MILPVCLRNPTLNPKQTWRSSSPSPLYPHSSCHSTTTHIKTAQHSIPTSKPMPILTPSGRPSNTNLNWGPTRRTPIHHYRTTSLHSIFPNHSSPNTTCKHCREPSIKMKSLCSILYYPGLVNQKRGTTLPHRLKEETPSSTISTQS